MAKHFQGIWGAFTYLDDTTQVIASLEAQGKDYSVFAPCPRHEIQHAMGNPQSRLPFITLGFGLMGLFFGFSLQIWTAMDWVLPVSAKPVVSLPAFFIIGFELTILLGGLSTAVGIFLLGMNALRGKCLPGSGKFKSYKNFSVDKFGIVVRCAETEAGEISRLMKQHHAEEVVREF